MPSLRNGILNKENSDKQMRYLKALYQRASNSIKKDDGADEIIPVLIEYLQDRYKPARHDTATLLNIYTHLYEWRPQDPFGEDAYIFTSVQGALLYITTEAMQNEPLNDPLKRIGVECSQYLKELQQELKTLPQLKPLTKKRIAIVSEALETLQDEELSNTAKATSFYQTVSDNQAIFSQEQHPRAILFLKAVAVFAAFCIGAGIGGVFAYQKLFNQKHEEKPKEGPFNLSIFQPSSDNSLELEQDIDKENKDTPDGPSAN